MDCPTTPPHTPANPPPSIRSLEPPSPALRPVLIPAPGTSLCPALGCETLAPPLRSAPSQSPVLSPLTGRVSAHKFRPQAGARPQPRPWSRFQSLALTHTTAHPWTHYASENASSEAWVQGRSRPPPQPCRAPLSAAARCRKLKPLLQPKTGSGSVDGTEEEIAGRLAELWVRSSPLGDWIHVVCSASLQEAGLCGLPALLGSRRSLGRGMSLGHPGHGL